MNRRTQIALTPEDQNRLLEESHTIILSSLDHRGYPHSVPMWYVADEGQVKMTTYAKSQKVVNLERDPRCSLLIEDGHVYEELRGLLIRGRATIERGMDAVLDALVKIQSKQGLSGAAGDIREAMRAAAAKRVLITITPERIASWDHRKLGGTY